MRGANPPPVEVEGLGPAATAVILLLGAALSVLVWHSLRRQQDAQIDRETGRYAAAAAGAIEAEINDLYESLRRRAELWDSTHGADPMAWQQSVELFLTENPSVPAILRPDPSRQVAGSAEGREILRRLVSDATGSEGAAEGDALIGPVVLEDGRPMFGVQVRVDDLERSRSALFAVLDPQIALRSVLDTRAIGYGIRVTAGSTEIYRRGGADGARELAQRAATEPVTPRVGAPWSVSVWPAIAGAQPAYLESPVVALSVGLLASSLLSAAVHFGTLAWRRAHALRLATAALTQQVDESRRGESELKKLSEELEGRVTERTAELHETIVELETFNYSVSHDLRGPLGAIINFAAILAEDYDTKLDATGREHLQRIVKSASSAVAMMDALLAYSRSGRSELHRVPLDMRRLAQEVVDELAASSPELPCAVEIGDLPRTCADESMMRFVLANLISNACKFVPAGQAPRVQVGGNTVGSEAIYFVRDDGVGFDMRFANKLFKVFERLHPTEQYQGQGVGLAIVARMVRRHGGRVWAQGAVGKGATFHFSVPAAESGDDVRSSS